MTTQAFLALELRKIEGHIQSAMPRISHARTVQEICSAMHIPVPPYLRSVVRGTRSLSALNHAAETRAEQLLQQDLHALELLATREERRSQVGRLRSRNWALLQGNFPRVYAMALREAEKLVRSAPLEKKDEGDLV